MPKVEFETATSGHQISGEFGQTILHPTLAGLKYVVIGPNPEDENKVLAMKVKGGLRSSKDKVGDIVPLGRDGWLVLND